MPDTHSECCNTIEFLASLQARNSLWDDEEIRTGLLALARKCDVAHKLYQTYETDWKRPLCKDSIPPHDWLLFIEILFKAAKDAPDAGNAVKLLNSIANAVSALQSIDSIDATNIKDRWDALAEEVFARLPENTPHII